MEEITFEYKNYTCVWDDQGGEWYVRNLVAEQHISAKKISHIESMIDAEEERKKFTPIPVFVITYLREIYPLLITNIWYDEHKNGHPELSRRDKPHERYPSDTSMIFPDTPENRILAEEMLGREKVANIMKEQSRELWGKLITYRVPSKPIKK